MITQINTVKGKKGKKIRKGVGGIIPTAIIYVAVFLIYGIIKYPENKETAFVMAGIGALTAVAMLTLPLLRKATVILGSDRIYIDTATVNRYPNDDPRYKTYDRYSCYIPYSDIDSVEVSSGDGLPYDGDLKLKSGNEVIFCDVKATPKLIKLIEQKLIDPPYCEYTPEVAEPLKEISELWGEILTDFECGKLTDIWNEDTRLNYCMLEYGEALELEVERNGRKSWISVVDRDEVLITDSETFDTEAQEKTANLADFSTPEELYKYLAENIF